MIAELFYPKELKEIIADLRAKDDLNKRSLRLLNKQIYLLFLFIFMGLWASYYSVVFVLILVISPFLVWYEAKNYFKKYMRPYVVGEKVECIVVSVVSSGVSAISVSKFTTACIFRVREKTGDREYTTSQTFDWGRSRIFLEKGQEITIYSNAKSLLNAMPDVFYFKSKYSPQKSKIEEM